jgi:translocation and assembly module TamB
MAQRFFIPRLILWPIRLVIALLLLSGIALAGIIGWLSSDSGSRYITQMVNEEIAPGIGYRIEMDGLGFSFPLTASLGSLQLSDSKGVWLRAKDLSVHIIPTPSILDHLIIRRVSAGTIELLRQPETVQTQSSTANESGGMDVSLMKAVIDQLSLSPALTGMEKPLDIKLQTSVHYGARDELVTVKNITLTHPQLQLDGKASINLKSNVLQADIKTTDTSLAAWVADIKGYAMLAANISGTLDAPAFDATLKAHDLAYSDQSIPSLTAHTKGTINGSDVAGDLSLDAGEAKTLNLTYALAGEQLSLANINANYDGNSAQGTLTLNTQSLLADGDITIALPSLETVAPLIPEPSLHTLKGRADAAITLSATNNKQAAKSTITLAGITSAYANIKHAVLDASFSDVMTTMPDHATITAQGISASGNTVSKADIAVTRKDNAWNTKLSAQGSAPEPFHVNANAAIKQLETQGWSVLLSSLKADYAGIPLQSNQPIILTTSETDDVIDAPSFTLADGRYSLKAKRTASTIDATLNGKAIKLAKLTKDIPDALQSATATIAATLNGSMAAPIVKADLTVDHIMAAPSAPAVKLIANIQASDKTISVTSTISDGKTANSTIEASLPIQFSLEPFAFDVSDTAPIKGKANLSLDITALSRLLVPPPHIIKGFSKGNLTFAGTMDNPVIHGDIAFTEGQYDYQELGVSLKKIEAHLIAQGKRFTLDRFHAEDSKGNPVSGKGFVDLANDTMRYDAGFTTDGLDLFHHPNLQAIIAADLTMQGDASGGTLNGTITSKTMEIRLPDRFVSNVPELNVVQTIPPTHKPPADEASATAYPLMLDVTFIADNQVFVRGWGVDAEFQGNLAIKGNANAPDIAGKLSTIRGRYEEFGKQFIIKTGELLFEGTIPPAPYLNVVTAVKSGDVEVRPTITGPVLTPKLSITSSPAMSQEEALSHLLFGKDTKKISAMQAAQLANSIRKLSGEGGGGFDPLGEIRDMVGVDEIKVNNDGDDDASPSVGVGKYISDDIYLEVERGAEATSGKARIEVEVTPSISVESSTGAAGQSSIGLNWKHDY